MIGKSINVVIILNEEQGPFTLPIFDFPVKIIGACYILPFVCCYSCSQQLTGFISQYNDLTRNMEFLDLALTRIYHFYLRHSFLGFHVDLCYWCCIFVSGDFS